MSELDDNSTNSIPADGDDDQSEFSLGLEGSVDWDERNRELFAERNRLTLSLEELRTSVDIGEASMGSKQEIRLRNELLKNYSQIIDTNRGLVMRYVKKFTKRSTPEQAEDYLAAAYEGLLIAINNYDLERGSFFSFARIYVRREVQKAVKDNEHDNIGSRDFEQRPLVMLTFRQLQDGLGVDSPSAEEVAAKSGVSLVRVERILRARPTESLSDRLVYAKYANRKNQERKEENWDSPTTEEKWFEHVKSVTADLTITELIVLIRRKGFDGWEPDTIAALARRLDWGTEAIRRAEVRVRKKI